MSNHLDIKSSGGVLSVAVLSAVIQTEVGPLTLTGDQFQQLVGTGVIEQPAPAPSEPAPAPTEPAPPPVVYTKPARLNGVEYDTVELAVQAATVGDTVYVQPGVWKATQAYVSYDRDIILEGILGPNGERPELQGDPNVRLEWGKSIILARTENVVIRNLKLTNARNGDDNGAAIRNEPGVKTLRVENCEITDNENGLLLNPDPGLEVWIVDTNIHKNGQADVRKGYSHNIYANAIGRLNVVRSRVTDSVDGHDLKSRAFETYVTDSVIGGSRNGCAIDFPDGGTLVVTDTDFHKNADAARKHMMSFCAESVATDGRVHKFRFENALFTNNRDGTRSVQVNNHPSVPVEYDANCLFVGDETFEGLYVRE